MKQFLDNFIPDRIRIFKEDKTTEYIYQLLRKHCFGTIDELKDRYKITAHYIRSEITFTGSKSDIYDLFRHFDAKGVSFLSVTQESLIVEIDDFLRKVY